jgi:hypothetical protein
VLIPLLMVLFVAIGDFARLYTTMMTIESAAREAADYGAFDSQYWTNETAVRQNMTHRACLAASSLPDYVGTKDDVAATCTNPEIVAIELVSRPGGTTCTDSNNPFPCWVRVTLEYDFNVILPLQIDFFGVQFGFPSPVTFSRTSVFAITDLQLHPSPTPTPPPATPTPTPDPDATPTPTPDPDATPTPTPDPDATPTPTPLPTPDVTPTPTPDVTPTPTPDVTPIPNPEPTPTPTPEPVPAAPALRPTAG